MQNRKELVQTMRQKMESGQVIVVAGVDQLNHVRCCQEAECDLILLYPTSKYEKAKNRFLAGFLAFGNTNEMMQKVESSGSGPDSTQGLRPRLRRERNPERPPRKSHGDWPFLRPPERKKWK